MSKKRGESKEMVDAEKNPHAKLMHCGFGNFNVIEYKYNV